MIIWIVNMLCYVNFYRDSRGRDRMVAGFINTCHHCLSPLMLWVRIPLRIGVLDTPLCDNICQWLAAGRCFSPGTRVSSTNKTDRHDITDILLKVSLNAITLIYLYITNHHKHPSLSTVFFVGFVLFIVLGFCIEFCLCFVCLCPVSCVPNVASVSEFVIIFHS